MNRKVLSFECIRELVGGINPHWNVVVFVTQNKKVKSSRPKKLFIGLNESIFSEIFILVLFNETSDFNQFKVLKYCSELSNFSTQNYENFWPWIPVNNDSRMFNLLRTCKKFVPWSLLSRTFTILWISFGLEIFLSRFLLVI